jgi:hypothetical protein
VQNTAGYLATVGAGEWNTASGWEATVGGGGNNTASGNEATVPGGSGNVAAGQGSFVAGVNATDIKFGTTNNNSFVWGDGTRQSVSQGSNTFNILATGGVYVYNNSTNNNYVYLAPGAPSWNSISDRNTKKNFRDVDTVAVLEKLASIPVQKWNYKGEPDDACPHIGPMAQDFKAAFYPGRDDKGISTLEFDGVELAAIQGLNRKLEQTRAENAELREQLKQLKALVLQYTANQKGTQP